MKSEGRRALVFRRVSLRLLSETAGISVVSLFAWAPGVIVIAPPVAHYNPIVPSRTLLFCIPGSSLFFSVLRLQEFVEKMLTAVSVFLVDAADRAWAVAERFLRTDNGENCDLEYREYRMITSNYRAVWLRDIVSVEKRGDLPVALRAG